MKGFYVQNGDALDYENNTGKEIEAGDVIVLQDRIGVAGTTFKPKETGTVHVVGVFRMPKAPSDSDIEIGQYLYFDEENGLTTDSDGNPFAGYAAAFADKDDPTALVKLNS